MYIRFMPGYVFNGNQKFQSGQRAAHFGGIEYYGIGRNLNIMDLCPVQSCNNLNEPYLGQNQGNNITMVTGRWYYLEYRVILNTIDVRNGTFQMWIDDCGSNGLGCTGTPTLRESRTDVLYRGTGFGMFNGQIGGYFMDIWGNPSDGGEIRFDQIIVSKTGPIGFMGATASACSTTTWRPCVTSRPGVTGDRVVAPARPLAPSRPSLPQ